MMRLLTCLLVGLALLAAAACGEDRIIIVTPAGSPTPADEQSPTTEPTPSPTGEPSPTATVTPSDNNREPVEGEGTDVPPGGAILVDVRTGVHEDFDRIVFDFRGGVPDYRLEYVEPPILEDASGREVEIIGDAFLQVRLSPAAAHDPSTGDPTYEGPRELMPDLPSLQEAELTGDFEGVVTWVLGLSEDEDFQVLTLEGPFRLVVDIDHP